MKTEQRRKFIINFIYFLIIFGLIIVFARFALPVLTPFVIAFVVSIILGPLVRFLTKKLPIKRGLIATVLVVLFYAVIGLAIILGGIELSKSLIGLIGKIPGLYEETIEPFFWDMLKRINELLERLPEDTLQTFTESATDFISNIGTTITNISFQLISVLGNTATSVPGLFFDLIITIVSTVFFATDGGMICQFILGQFSEENQILITDVTVTLKKIVKQYIFSYALIMLVTFVELFIGFQIIGIGNAALIAALIAIFDLLPIVGSGVIICPWAVVCLVRGDYGIGIGLFILWCVICIIRYIIEPKIVGDRVGLHPLVTLISMVLGTYLFGGIGILLLPLGVAVVQNLNASGVVHLYNHTVIEKKNSKKTHLFDKVLHYVKSVLKKKK